MAIQITPQASRIYTIPRPLKTCALRTSEDAPAMDGAPRGSRTPTPFGPWILSPGRLPFRHRGFRCARHGWCPEGESNPHAFRPVDFESRSSAIPTPGLRFANQAISALHAIARAFHVVPSLVILLSGRENLTRPFFLFVSYNSKTAAPVHPYSILRNISVLLSMAEPEWTSPS